MYGPAPGGTGAPVNRTAKGDTDGWQYTFNGGAGYDAAGVTNCSGSPKVCTPEFGGPGVEPALANDVFYSSDDFDDEVSVHASTAYPCHASGTSGSLAC